MPSANADVGPLALPIAAGTTNAKLADPGVDGILDFLAFWAKNTLDAKLANLLGTSADAAPVANRFSFDPTDPRGHHVRLPVPSLYVWWDGRSRSWELDTLVYTHRVRDLQVLYVFQELPQLATMELRSGLLNAVDAAFHKASERGSHPLYAYGDSPLGTPLVQSLAPNGGFQWKYLGGIQGRFGIEDPKSGRDYPALRGTLNLVERTQLDTLEDPTDVLGDSPMSINAGDGETEAMPDFMNRFLTGPDGSEQD